MRQIREIFRPVQNLQEIRTLTATAPHESVSQRYSFIPTSAPLAVLADYGWQPAAFAEQRVRDKGKAGYQRHALKLRHEGQSKDALQLGQTLPELVLLNSHCGNASFQLCLALFELVCTNGLMVEREGIADRRVRHVGYTDAQVAETITSLVPQIPTILQDVDRFRQIKLLPAETRVFGEAAAELRWDSTQYQIDPERVIVARRWQQKEDSLWNVFNRTQEVVLRGGVYVQNKETRQSQHARAISSLSESIRLNKSLWRLTEEMAKIKTA